MDKKYALLGTIWVLVVVVALITHSFFPVYVKEKADLYEPFEYSQMYLENEPYSDLIIEYDYVEGHRPNKTAMSILERKVENYTDKENVVSKLDDEIPVNHTRVGLYDSNDISELNDAYMDYGREGDTISIHVLYLDGEWKEKENVLGLSKRPYQIVIFSRVVEDFAETLDEQLEKDIFKLDVEAPVLVHEFGHLLSLVGLGYESDHEDAEYPGHCDESAGDCVMAGYVEVKEDTDEKPPLEFCELCKEDLKQIKEMEDSFGFEDLVSYGTISGQYFVGIWASSVIIGRTGKKVVYNNEYREVEKSEESYSQEEYSGFEDDYNR